MTPDLEQMGLVEAARRAKLSALAKKRVRGERGKFAAETYAETYEDLMARAVDGIVTRAVVPMSVPMHFTAPIVESMDEAAEPLPQPTVPRRSVSATAAWLVTGFIAGWIACVVAGWMLS